MRCCEIRFPPCWWCTPSSTVASLHNSALGIRSEPKVYNFFLKQSHLRRRQFWHGGRSRGRLTQRSKGFRLSRFRYDFLPPQVPRTLHLCEGVTWGNLRARTWGVCLTRFGSRLVLPQVLKPRTGNFFFTGIVPRKEQYVKLLPYPGTYTNISHYLGLLPLNRRLSFLNSRGTSRDIYCRRAGVSARYSSRLMQRLLAIITLPSGLLKYFSLFTTTFQDILHSLPRRACRGGHLRRLMGRAPKTRGVARNPVDHPHGGRTKTVRNPLSPWGWVTKAR